jgi:hypothetical protein
MREVSGFSPTRTAGSSPPALPGPDRDREHGRAGSRARAAHRCAGSSTKDECPRRRFDLLAIDDEHRAAGTTT